MDAISRRAVVAGLPLIGLAATAVAQQTPSSPGSAGPPASTLLPVSVAKNGFTPAQATQFIKANNNATAMAGGDVSLFAFLNFPEVQPQSVIPREGNVAMLEEATDPAIGQVRVTSEFGDLSLDQYLADPRSRAQGYVVVRGGRIVYEQYPGMRPYAPHVWMSTTKTLPSFVIWRLAEQGKVDPQAPLDTYLTWMRGTEWAKCRVIDALDMRTGMDAIENDANRADPNSIVMRMNLSGSGTAWNGKLENLQDVLLAAKRIRPPAQSFDYGSPITLILPLVAEAVTNRRWCDLFHDFAWSKMTVEGDLAMGMDPQGLAMAHGLAFSRLRDLARWAMLYTPSWSKAAREKVVSDAYVREIQTGGDASIYMKGEMGPAIVKYFVGEQPRANHWQWDAVFADGDFYKSGLMGQGLYVSPETDTVVVFFSTVYNARSSAYARAIAKSFRQRN